MSEEEARKALFELNFEYMQHTPKERLELYDKYREERAKIREKLKEYYSKQLKLEKK